VTSPSDEVWQAVGLAPDGPPFVEQVTPPSIELLHVVFVCRLLGAVLVAVLLLVIMRP
jgi:hypothetical protein